MNPVELYKKLPGKNCGECSMKTCMPFALSLLRGESDLSECPYLSDDERTALKDSINLSDWREELIRRLQDEVREIRFSDVAEGIGAGMEGDSLVLNCLGRAFSIHPDGTIETMGHITPWIKILLLHYIRTRGRARLSGKWVAYRDLKSGMVKASSFERDCEEPLREVLDDNFEKVATTLQRLGAEIRNEFPAPHAWCVLLLPKVPVALLYWPADDEFDSKVSVLFDETADTFLDAESIIFLLEGLVRNIEMFLARG